MWALVRRLRDNGVTIILTTHYIDEAEEMADRIGVINKGELILVEEKAKLMKKLGKKQLTLHLQEPMAAIPPELAEWHLALKDGGHELEYTFDANAERKGIAVAAPPHERPRHRLQGPQHHAKLARGHFRRASSPNAEGETMTVAAFNRHAVWAIYRFEMARALRTVWQSLVTPVITTSLYFVVFGSAIGSRMVEIDGVAYGAFIVPGLIMLTLFTESIFNASFGIYFPKFTGTIYEVLSAPVSSLEIVLAYVGAAATKSIVLGLDHLDDGIVLRAAAHRAPAGDGRFPGLIATSFCLFGFIIGIASNNFEQMQIVPMLVVTPLTFLGGAFYSIDMLPPAWQHGRPVQSDRLFDLGLPLELLRQGRRRAWKSAWPRRWSSFSSALRSSAGFSKRAID